MRAMTTGISGLELEKRQQVRIDRICFRGGHAMWEVLVGFQGSVPQ
jgi:hypothetical protein